MLRASFTYRCAIGLLLAMMVALTLACSEAANVPNGNPSDGQENSLHPQGDADAVLPGGPVQREGVVLTSTLDMEPVGSRNPPNPAAPPRGIVADTRGEAEEGDSTAVSDVHTEAVSGGVDTFVKGRTNASSGVAHSDRQSQPEHLHHGPQIEVVASSTATSHSAADLGPEAANPAEGGVANGDGANATLSGPLAEDALPKDASEAVAIPEEDAERPRSADVAAEESPRPIDLERFLELSAETKAFLHDLKRRAGGRAGGDVGWTFSQLYASTIEALALGHFNDFVTGVWEGAAAGHSRLHWLLGVLHANGLGVPHSQAKAALHYTVAALQGIPEAHVALGVRHYKGYGLPKDCQRAKAHFREAADAVAMTYSGASDSHLSTGQLDAGGHRTATSRHQSTTVELESLIFRADNGSAASLTELGYRYLKGTGGVKHDWHRAQYYFQKAADMKYGAAYGALGQLYCHGDLTANPPIPRDLAKADHFFRLGSAARDGASLNGLGYLHAIGYLRAGGVAEGSDAGTPDFQSAALYFQECQRMQHPEGTYNLGVLHLHGRGVPVDIPEARRLFEVSGQLGSVLALWQLGKMYDRGGDKGCSSACLLYSGVCRYGSWLDQSSPSGYTLTADSYDVDEEEEGPRGKDEHHESTDDVDLSVIRNNYRKLQHEQLLMRRLSKRRAALRIHDTLAVSRSASPLLRFVEVLALTETDSSGLGLEAAELLEDIAVAGEGMSVANLVLKGYAEVDSPCFAKDGALPMDLIESLPQGAIFLDWSVLTEVRTPTVPTPKGGEPDVQKVWWRLTQREAKSMLLLRLLHRAESHASSYLRLGHFFFYGTSMLLGTDMSRARYYYELAVKSRSPAAFFSLAMMHQLGLDPTMGRSQRTNSVLTGRHHSKGEPATGEAHGEAWTPGLGIEAYPTHSTPPDAVALVWDAIKGILTNDPVTRDRIDLYLAYRLYGEASTSSARRVGERMAVYVAHMVLNLQWWYLYYSQVPGGLFRGLGISMPFYHGDADRPSPPPLGPDPHRQWAAPRHWVGFDFQPLNWLTYFPLGWISWDLLYQAESTLLLGCFGCLSLLILLRHHIA